jgi:DNA-directed RNA polymerase subunit omega
MSSQLLEEAAKMIPNTAVLINLVSRRVRQLSTGHRAHVEIGPRMSYADTALKEIVEGKITFESTDPTAEVPQS